MDMKLLSSAETADYLGIDRSTLGRWVHSGRLKPAHVNPGQSGAVLFFATDVRDLEDTIKQESALAATICPKCGQRLPEATA